MTCCAPKLTSALQPLFALLLLAAAGVSTALAASADHHGICGTYPGRVLTELGLHQQFVNQRLRQGFQPLASTATAAVDVGHIAVLPDDGTLVMPANTFDLDQRSLNFLPAAGGFSVQSVPSGFDGGTAATGFLLNPPPGSNPENIGDDGTRPVNLAFAFPFFGKTHTSVFVNSDGNLTFLEGDKESTPRSLSRFLTGPPRIAPYFADLDPSVGGQLTYFSSSDRFVVTWNAVPDYSESGIGPRETFQVVLRPDGRMEFSYAGINGREAVVGVSPGSFSALPNLVDLSAASGSPSAVGPVAEVFTAATQLDLTAVSRLFYKTHEDAYDFLIVFTTFDFDLGGAFAFEINIANQVRGIGQVFDPPLFDFSSRFGSSRLESLLNMGNLARYPADPSLVFLRGIDSTLSILGQEAGHRFLAYVNLNDPENGLPSTALLGRDFQHWNFFFHSDASVEEGNRIGDNGDGTFTTSGVVEHYSDLDQYLMGLRSPEEVAASFLVKNPNISFSPAHAPQLNVSFSGQRVNVTPNQIIEANGLRTPNAVISPKNFNFAFLLVAPRNSTPSAEQVAHLDRIRQAWESYFTKATSFRGTANTALVRGLGWTPSPLGLFAGSQVSARLEVLAASGSAVVVTLTNSNPLAVSAPSQVVIPGGTQSASFPITALASGRALLTAAAPGFETRSVVVEVLPGPAAPHLSLSIRAGNRQLGSPGSTLPQPLQVTLQDENQIPFAGASVEFVVSQGDASLTPVVAVTDGQGRASTVVTLGLASGPNQITASVAGTSLAVAFAAFSLGAAEVPSNGIVNGASFALNPLSQVSPGSIISIFGTNLSSTTVAAQSFPLPTRLASTTVAIGGIPAPLFSVSPTQINAQVPFELTGTTASLVVQNGVASSAAVLLTATPVLPGIFSLDSSGTGPGAITHASNQLLVTADSPAEAGEFVQIFSTGLGKVIPAISSGRAGRLQPLSETASRVTVSMNAVAAPVNFAGLAPGWVGVYQVNAQVPEGIRGTVAVRLTVEGVLSNTVTMEVR